MEQGDLPPPGKPKVCSVQFNSTITDSVGIRQVETASSAATDGGLPYVTPLSESFSPRTSRVGVSGRSLPKSSSGNISVVVSGA